MDYVCGLLRLTGVSTDHRDRLLFIRKLKPDWQIGLLNGVGGKIEEGETPLQAMSREWHEESHGTPSPEWQALASFEFVGGSKVHFFKAQSNELEYFRLHGRKNDAGERFEALAMEHALRRDDLIPNLKWLIPLAFIDTCSQVVHVAEVERGIP